MDDHDYLTDMNEMMDRFLRLQNTVKEILDLEEGITEVLKGLQDRIYKLENPDE